MKVRITVNRQTHSDDAGHVWTTIGPSNYVDAQTPTRFDHNGREYARVNVRPAGREAAKHHGIL